MVKVVYTDGSIELFNSNKQIIHEASHNLFKVEFKNHFVMIPDHAVRSIGVGHLETITLEKHGSATAVEEVFVYE